MGGPAEVVAGNNASPQTEIVTLTPVAATDGLSPDGAGVGLRHILRYRDQWPVLVGVACCRARPHLQDAPLPLALSVRPSTITVRVVRTFGPPRRPRRIWSTTLLR